MCKGVVILLIKWNCLITLKILFIANIDQEKWVYSYDGQGRAYQNCKFHDPRNRGYCATAWPNIGHINKYALSSTLSIYSSLIANVIRNYHVTFFRHCWFLFLLWWARWFANKSPSDKKSDTQVTVKFRGSRF